MPLRYLYHIRSPSVTLNTSCAIQMFHNKVHLMLKKRPLLVGFSVETDTGSIDISFDKC